MIFGYIRLGLEDDDVIAQYDALKRADCEEVTVEFAPLTSTERPKLERMLSTLEPGDILVVPQLSRLGCSLLNLAEIWDRVNTAGAALRSLSEGIDGDTEQGRLAFAILGNFTNIERAVLSQRTLAGMDAARKRGVRIGRPHVLTETQINHARELIDRGEPVSAVARTFGVNRATMKRAINRSEE